MNNESQMVENGGGNGGGGGKVESGTGSDKLNRRIAIGDDVIKKLRGKYTAITKIGEGSSSEVYAVRNTKTQSDLILKMMNLRSTNEKKDFKNECRIHKSLSTPFSTPYICQLRKSKIVTTKHRSIMTSSLHLRAWKSASQLPLPTTPNAPMTSGESTTTTTSLPPIMGVGIMEMEKMEADLLQYILLHERLSEFASQKIFLELLHAVKYIHDRGVAHLDLKPDNILLSFKPLPSSSSSLSSLMINQTSNTNGGSGEHVSHYEGRQRRQQQKRSEQRGGGGGGGGGGREGGSGLPSAVKLGDFGYAVEFDAKLNPQSILLLRDNETFGTKEYVAPEARRIPSSSSSSSSSSSASSPPTSPRSPRAPNPNYAAAYYHNNNNNHHQQSNHVTRRRGGGGNGEEGLRMVSMEKADVYSLGVVLFTMITGSFPFQIADDGYTVIAYYSLKYVKEFTSGDECYDLLKQMLCPHPSIRPTLSAVMNHPWLKKTSVYLV